MSEKADCQKKRMSKKSGWTSYPVPRSDHGCALVALLRLSVLARTQMHGVAIGPSKRNAAWSTVPRLLLSGGQPGCETTVTAPTQMAAKIGGVVRPAVMRTDDTCKLHSVPACVADIHSVLYSPQSPLLPYPEHAK